MEQLFKLYNDGKIRPVIDSAWALEDVSFDWHLYFMFKYCGFIIIHVISIFVGKGGPWIQMLNEIQMFYRLVYRFGQYKCSIGLYADLGKFTKSNIHKNVMFLLSKKNKQIHNKLPLMIFIIIASASPSLVKNKNKKSLYATIKSWLKCNIYTFCIKLEININHGVFNYRFMR